MVAPGCEQKLSLSTPPQISQQPSAGQANAYSEMIVSTVGVKKVEIINNEVIAAGQLKQNL